MKPIRISTHGSQLALWQTETVQYQLGLLGYPTEIVGTKSEGNLELTTPLYEMGITGISARALDIALLRDEIDMIIHSMKDVPTLLPDGIAIGAVFEYGNPHGILIYKGGVSDLNSRVATIAMGSLHRKARWLHRYPHRAIRSLRGNVNTRLQKSADNPWDGAIFAAAGLRRIDKSPEDYLVLDWMLPVPTQGAIMVLAHEDNVDLQGILLKIHDGKTYIETQVERAFLRALEGGCTAPIGTHAEFDDEQVHFKGGLRSEDRKQEALVNETFDHIDEFTDEWLASKIRDSYQNILELRIINKTDRLKAVVLGTAVSNGTTPTLEKAYDPESAEHIKADTYLIEKDMVAEMNAFAAVLQRYGVQVYRPEIIRDCDQIFTRDIGFVTDDVFIKTSILPDRRAEFQAIKYIIKQTNPDKVVTPPEEAHIEGGNVIPWNEHIFIGTYKGDDYKKQVVARTNMAGVTFIQKLFPHKKVKEFGLVKSKIEARDSTLYLDCCFRPVGKDKTVIYKGGFRSEAGYQYLVNIFSAESLFRIGHEGIYEVSSNVFSISPEVVVSEKHSTRLNAQFRV